MQDVARGTGAVPYLHLGANEPQTRLSHPVQLASHIKPSRTDKGHLPLLTPMSEVAGRMAVLPPRAFAMGFEAKVTVVDRSLSRLDELDWRYGAQLNTVYSTFNTVERHVRDADLVIGSVLGPGAAVTNVSMEEMIKSMRPGSVVVDIAIDQGGCFETSRPTSHADPVYTEHGVIPYCVTNMPGAVAQTSTVALNNARYPCTL